MADFYTNTYNPDVLSCLANLSNDEVLTPPEIVNRMLDMLPQDALLVCESGIHFHDDVALMRNHHVHAFLVGEAFMRADEPGAKLKELFF